MSLTESLTVEITADSSGLESELQRVGSLVDGLSSRLASVTSQIGGAVGALSRVGTAVGPINQVNAALDGVTQRLGAIRQATVTINVGPAMSALQALSSMISRVISQIQALNAMSGGVRGGAAVGGGVSIRPSGSGGATPAPVRFASGGYVSGRRGVDRVPAYVSAGEFVVRPEVVGALGRPFFEQLNAGIAPSGAARSSNSGGGRVASHVATGRSLSSSDGGVVFQDVTIQMDHAVELDDVLTQVELTQQRNADRFG